MRYAEIRAGRVVDIRALPEGFTIADSVPQEHTENFIACGPGVEIGWELAGGQLRPFSPPDPTQLTPEEFAAAGVSLSRSIDVEAERQRLRWITPGTGQAMTYARKVEEARRVEIEIDPQPEAFPMLAASIGIDGADLAAVAATILAMDAAWGRIGGAIEARRLTLKRDVGQAETAEALAAIDITSGWPE